MSQQRRAIIFGGGGTGGHIYPALAVLERLETRAQHDNVELAVTVLASRRSVDEDILTTAGFEQRDEAPRAWRALPAQPIGARPRTLSRFVRGWGSSVREARRAIRAARRWSGAPPQVVAMGGFVAAPVARAARCERAPLTLVNLDAVPGRSNRLVARWASSIVTAAPLAETNANEWPVIGPIVRRAAIAAGDQAECKTRLGLDPARPVLVVTGGSQGARSINELVPAVLEGIGAAASSWQVLHQAGDRDADALKSRYRTLGIGAVVVARTGDIGLWLGAADLAVSRGGAGSVAELRANRTPALILPYPGRHDDHQRHNAADLEQAGAALVEADRGSLDLNLLQAGAALERLMLDASARQAMRDAASALGYQDGAEAIAARLW